MTKGSSRTQVILATLGRGHGAAPGGARPDRGGRRDAPESCPTCAALEFYAVGDHRLPDHLHLAGAGGRQTRRTCSAGKPFMLAGMIGFIGAFSAFAASRRTCSSSCCSGASRASLAACCSPRRSL